MLLLLVNDIHLSERAPSSCTDSYSDDLFELVGAIAQVAAERCAAAVILAGDVFHHKAPSRSSHRLVQRAISAFKAFPCEVWVVPGNHDIQNDRLESLMLTQPLGVLVRAGAVRILSGFHSLPVFGLPWQQRWEQQALTDALELYRGFNEQPGPPALLVTHAPLYPPGLELKWEHYPAADWAEAMGGKGCCWYGHVHERHGVWAAGGVSPVTFANFGAISRGSLHEHNLTRQVAIGAWDSETGEFEEIVLPHKPADQVFRLREAAEVADMAVRLDEFLAGVSGTTLEVMTSESVISYIRSQGHGAAEASLAEELLNYVEESS
jgi:predicted phosphodiesterase